ncbi:MAG: hypothetical protein ABIG60_06045 [Patescibacteria group bacterium]
MEISEAKKIMENNFIGPDELNKISAKLNIAKINNEKITAIPFQAVQLEKMKDKFILILGVGKNVENENLTLNKMREFLGWDPEIKEPCFYNQDWYINEDFANKTCLENKWYLIRKKVIDETRSRRPEEILKNIKENEKLPLAILTVFTFFSYWFLTNGKILWQNDFIWCADQDKGGDRIYTGRYQDPNRIKNGFNIHRHLSIKPNYGAITQLV